MRQGTRWVQGFAEHLECLEVQNVQNLFWQEGIWGCIGQAVYVEPGCPSSAKCPGMVLAVGDFGMVCCAVLRLVQGGSARALSAVGLSTLCQHLLGKPLGEWCLLPTCQPTRQPASSCMQLPLPWAALCGQCCADLRSGPGRQAMIIAVVAVVPCWCLPVA